MAKSNLVDKKNHKESKTDLLFVGDLTLTKANKQYDPMKMIKSFTIKSDISFCNLETVLGDNESRNEVIEKKNIIVSPLKNLDYLKDIGFKIVNIANNHIYDKGKEGCLRTISSILRSNIDIVGLKNRRGSKPVIIERNGIKIGILGYADYGFKDILSTLRRKTVIENIEELNKIVDLIIVSVHWGNEYIYYPSPKQQAIAREMINTGAKIVVGHHPHVVQGIERYKNGIIAYSLGNFYFFIDEYPKKKKHLRYILDYGIVLNIELKCKAINNIEAIPIMLNEKKEVIVHNNFNRKLFNKWLYKISKPLERKKISWIFWIGKSNQILVPHVLKSWKYRIKKYGKKQYIIMFKRFIRDPIFLIMLIWYVFRSLIK